MRKFLSLLLAVCMLFSMTTMVSAEEKQTTIRYVADGTSSYEVTVPSLMTPGETKQVTLEGTWTTEEKVVVSAPDSVVLTNNIDGDTEELAVTFNGFEVVGDNRESISLSEDIAVASMPEDVIFGTWEGIVTYTVSVEDVVEEPVMMMFSFRQVSTGDVTVSQQEYTFVQGMTWREWINSDYNTDNFYLEGTGEDLAAVCDYGTYIVYYVDDNGEKVYQLGGDLIDSSIVYKTDFAEVSGRD